MSGRFAALGMTGARWSAARLRGLRRRGAGSGVIPPVLTSIRVRLTLWYVPILAVVLLVFGGLVYGAQARAIDADARDKLRNLGRELAATYDASDGLLHPELIWEKGGKLPGDTGPAVVSAAPPPEKRTALLGEDTLALFLDREGRIVQRLGGITEASIGQQPFKQPLTALAARETFSPIMLPDRAGDGGTRRYLVYTTPVTGEAALGGTLILGLPDETAVRLGELRRTLLVLTPATLLLTAGAGYWLAARAMRPVRLISRAAQEIGATDLSRRLHLPSSDELGELAGTVDRMLDRLEATFARQRQFTADASHELRTPLTIVDLEVSRALAAPRTPEEYVRALGTIGAENARMTRLVNELLVLARADTGRAIMQSETLDLSDLALEVVERLGPLARRLGVTLTIGDLPELPIVGDRLYLAQLLTNLVENGIVYTSGHGACVTVETGQCLTGEHTPRAWVRVTDDGPGIADEHLPHLFDRFYRVDTARSRAASGAGLGLAIAEWIAQAHGGSIAVTSGSGSTFVVRLPFVPMPRRVPRDE